MAVAVRERFDRPAGQPRTRGTGPCAVEVVELDPRLGRLLEVAEVVAGLVLTRGQVDGKAEVAQPGAGRRDDVAAAWDGLLPSCLAHFKDDVVARIERQAVAAARASERRRRRSSGEFALRQRAVALAVRERFDRPAGQPSTRCTGPCAGELVAFPPRRSSDLEVAEVVAGLVLARGQIDGKAKVAQPRAGRRDDVAAAR